MLWMPAFVVYSIRELCQRCIPDSFVLYVYALHLTNSMMNPLVYSFRMRIFRDVLKALCRKRRQNMHMELIAVQQKRLGNDLEGSFTPNKHEDGSPTIQSTSGHN